MNAYVKDRMAGRKTMLGATVGLMLIAMLLVALASAAQVSAKSTATIKRAALSGSTAFPAVNGEAKWKAKEGERELEVQIEDAKTLAGKRLTVRDRRQARRPHEGQRAGAGPAGQETRRRARACRRR